MQIEPLLPGSSSEYSESVGFPAVGQPEITLYLEDPYKKKGHGTIKTSIKVIFSKCYFPKEKYREEPS